MATYQPYPHQPPPRQGNGLAIAAMVLGIIALVTFWFWPIAGITGVLALIFGGIGIARASRAGSGKGMAIAGVVTGGLGILLAIVFIVVIVALVTGGDRRFREPARSDVARVQLDVVVRDLYPRWVLKTRQECPRDLFEVARSAGESRNAVIDPWNNELKHRCSGDPKLGGAQFGVYSLGPDGEDDTGDEIRSWR